MGCLFHRCFQALGKAAHIAQPAKVGAPGGGLSCEAHSVLEGLQGRRNSSHWAVKSMLRTNSSAVRVQAYMST